MFGHDYSDFGTGRVESSRPDTKLSVLYDAEAMRLNPIRAQGPPVAWGLICLFGLVVFVQKLFAFPYMSSGWQGGIFGILLVIFGFVAIEGWWFASQQEILIGADEIRVRSWLQVVLGRPGSVVKWTDLRQAALIVDRGKKLELRTDAQRFVFWAALWDPSAIVQFMDRVEQHGVPTRMDWVPQSRLTDLR